MPRPDNGFRQSTRSSWMTRSRRHEKAAEKNPDILDQLETQITATDRQIDRLTISLAGAA
jgi:hypothetical protein